MELDLERVRASAKEADTEDLLNRVTVFRGGMEEAALEVLEEELRTRGVGAEEVREYANRMRPLVLWERPGLAARCHLCDSPATRLEWRWRRFLGLVPLFRRQVPCCPIH